MYIIMQLLRPMTGSTKGQTEPNRKVGKTAAFTAHLVRLLAQDFPSSQLAMEPFGSIGGIGGGQTRIYNGRVSPLVSD
jgi:hypothetical protein